MRLGSQVFDIGLPPPESLLNARRVGWKTWHAAIGGLEETDPGNIPSRLYSTEPSTGHFLNPVFTIRCLTSSADSVSLSIFRLVKFSSWRNIYFPPEDKLFISPLNDEPFTFPFPLSHVSWKVRVLPFPLIQTRSV